MSIADRSSDIRTGYQSAITLIDHASTSVWLRYNNTVLGHSILLAGIILLLTSSKSLDILVLILSGFGITLSVLSFGMVLRGFRYIDIYVESAKELEKLLDVAVQTLQEGSRVKDGFSSRFVIYGSLTAFILIYLFLLLYQCREL